MILPKCICTKQSCKYVKQKLIELNGGIVNPQLQVEISILLSQQLIAYLDRKSAKILNTINKKDLNDIYRKLYTTEYTFFQVPTEYMSRQTISIPIK